MALSRGEGPNHHSGNEYFSKEPPDELPGAQRAGGTGSAGFHGVTEAFPAEVPEQELLPVRAWYWALVSPLIIQLYKQVKTRT